MVLIMVTSWYPLAAANEVGKRYLKNLTKYPPDASLGKNLLIGVSSVKEGIKVISIADVVKGKYEDSLRRIAQSNQEFADIEGFSYEIETLMDITEAMPIIGMEAPENG